MVALAYTIELANAMHETDSWYFLGAGTVLGIPTNMLALIIVSLVMHFFLTRLRPGIHNIAVSANRKAARHAGVPIQQTLFISYLLSGTLTALAGLFYAA